MLSPQDIAATACAIGRAKGLLCRYKGGKFEFFRRGVYLGATTDPTKVVKRMEKYL